MPITGCARTSLEGMNLHVLIRPYSLQIFRSVIIPIATHSAISMVCSALIFPESVNAQYTKRLIAVFDPLAKALRTQPDLLKLSPLDAKFDPKPFQALYVGRPSNLFDFAHYEFLASTKQKPVSSPSAPPPNS